MLPALHEGLILLTMLGYRESYGTWQAQPLEVFLQGSAPSRRPADSVGRGAPMEGAAGSGTGCAGCRPRTWAEPWSISVFGPGPFGSGLNRFIAHVELEGTLEVCHVKNTGRCRELLVPGARVWLEESANPARKTRFDLVAVEKAAPSGPLLINMDSQAPNRVFGEWAKGGHFVPGLFLLRPETTYSNSRFDFYWKSSGECPEEGFVEVKGVTLEENGVARFPDAPYPAGGEASGGADVRQGRRLPGGGVFIVQMAGMKWMEPNDATHPEFGAALRRAAAAGVEVMALECRVWPRGAGDQRPPFRPAVSRDKNRRARPACQKSSPDFFDRLCNFAALVPLRGTKGPCCAGRKALRSKALRRFNPVRGAPFSPRLTRAIQRRTG